MKIGVLLHGCGVYDGTEIHEAVLSLLALEKAGYETLCLAPDKQQYHVINHLKDEVMSENRNVLLESARIARGKIEALQISHASAIDALVMPGGFGTAKNLTHWAFEGSQGSIDPLIKEFLVTLVKTNKPIVALCMSPTTLAKALENTAISASLSVGSTSENSPYPIAEISNQMEGLGAKPAMKTVHEIAIDEKNRIICAPCYMMEANILQVYNNIKMAITQLDKWLKA